MDQTTVSEHSRYVESALKHAFLAELLSCMWQHYPGEEVMVYNAEVDSQGFDVVLTFRGITRHVQLKSMTTNSRTRSFRINQKLSDVVGGCILLIIYDATNLKIMQYRLYAFGSGKLPDITKFPLAKSIKANALGIKSQKKNIRMVPLHAFHSPWTLEEISRLLFCHPQSNAV